MKQQDSLDIELHKWLKHSSWENEQLFNGKRTMLQWPMNNGAMTNEQWCDDQRTMVRFRPYKHETPDCL